MVIRNVAYLCIYILYFDLLSLHRKSGLSLLSTGCSVVFADVGFPIYNLGNIVPMNNDEQTLYIGRKKLKGYNRYKGIMISLTVL